VLTSCGLLDRDRDKKEKAWIYKHRELGTFLYCDADQGMTQDYIFQGTGRFKSSKVERCSLAK